MIHRVTAVTEDVGPGFPRVNACSRERSRLPPGALGARPASGLGEEPGDRDSGSAPQARRSRCTRPHPMWADSKGGLHPAGLTNCTSSQSLIWSAKNTDFAVRSTLKG